MIQMIFIPEHVWLTIFLNSSIYRTNNQLEHNDCTITGVLFLIFSTCKVEEVRIACSTTVVLHLAISTGTQYLIIVPSYNIRNMHLLDSNPKSAQR